MLLRWTLLLGLFVSGLGMTHVRADDDPIAEGKIAPDSTISLMNGQEKKFSDLVDAERTVVVFLRGFPGYQCPICSRQVSDLVRNQKRLLGEGAKVVLVYPGTRGVVFAKSDEFFRRTELPDGFSVALDPDFALSNACGLRWDQSRETVYPTTLVLDANRKVLFKETSRSHGGRVSATKLIGVLQKLND